MIYARYSTEDQNPHSIDDQVMICRKYLETLNLGPCDISIEQDEELTGELLSRPGIDRVRALIRQGKCDLVIAEDASRFYRLSDFAMPFFGEIHDLGARAIAINDHLDTTRPEWRRNAFFAAFRSELYNQDTSERIRRAMSSRWEAGNVVNPLWPGYIRLPVYPTTNGTPERGPYRDVKDEKWTPVIYKAFEMIASGEPLWRVANYLSEVGFPKSIRAKISRWTDQNVRSMVLCPIYSGRELYRKQTNVKKYMTGKSVPQWNPPEKVQVRNSPDLAHVPRWLQEKAIAAMRQRSRRKAALPGSAEMYRGIPRDRRGPLSMHFICGVCGATMYRDGSGYRCANSKRRQTLKRQDGPPCWNRVGPRPATVHRKLSEAIVDALTKSLPSWDGILRLVERFVIEGSSTDERRIEELRSADADLSKRRSRLLEAIEKGGDLESLVSMLREREAEQNRVRADIEQLNSQERHRVPLPTIEDVQKRIEAFKGTFIESMGAEAGPILRRLTSPIRAVPYRPFDRDRRTRTGRDCHPPAGAIRIKRMRSSTQ